MKTETYNNNLDDHKLMNKSTPLVMICYEKWRNPEKQIYLDMDQRSTTTSRNNNRRNLFTKNNMRSIKKLIKL